MRLTRPNKALTEFFLRISELIVSRSYKVWQQNDVLYWLLGLAKQENNCLKVLHKFTRDTIKERRVLYNQLKENAQTSTEKDKLLGEG